jgi:hypothetical protein
MQIDPVVLLAEELRSTEAALRSAMRRYERDRAPTNGEKVNLLLQTVKSIYAHFADTVPTSSLGASELLRIVAQRLPFSMAGQIVRMNEIADRLEAGRREQSDLIWLRAMRTALKAGQGGQEGIKAAPLVGLALAGACRPVVIFRAAQEPPEDELAGLLRPGRLH